MYFMQPQKTRSRTGSGRKSKVYPLQKELKNSLMSFAQNL